jgi:hypothetical protein
VEILQDNTTALFPQHEIGAFVLPIFQGKAEENPIALQANGILGLSRQESKRVTGFRLGLIVLKDARVVIVQRNLGHSPQRLYHQFALSTLKEEEWYTWVMMDHMRVYRKDWKDGRGVIAWTVWQATIPNRIDLWFLTPEGLTQLFQVGVIARGEGEDQYFRLLGELRGEWQLCRDNQRGVVGIPMNPVWGSFSVRRPILQDLGFKNLLEKTTLPSKKPSEEELSPPLRIPLEPDQAVMDWWSSFTGTRGQGPIAPHGSDTWVCGEDFLGEPDPDDIVRLPRGTRVSYEGTLPLEGRTQKLLKVKRVS